MKKIGIAFVLFFSFFNCLGQKVQFVNARNGLIVREYPNKKAKRIGKFNYGMSLYVIKETGIELEVLDEGKRLLGEWIEVKGTNDDLSGFIFDGFVSNEVINKGDEFGNYYLTYIDAETKQKCWENELKSKEPKIAEVYLRNQSHKDISSFALSNLDLYDNSSLRAFVVEGLKNVSEVVVVESNYSACCSTQYSSYLLVMENDKVVSLPEITNDHCDGPEPYFDYIFPNNKDGEKDKIKYVKVIPQTEAKQEKIEIIKTYSWDGVHVIEE